MDSLLKPHRWSLPLLSRRASLFCAAATLCNRRVCGIRKAAAYRGTGPVAYLHYTHNEYEAIQGFWDLNAQVGVELTSHIRF